MTLAKELRNYIRHRAKVEGMEFASQTVEKSIDDLPEGGVLFWRPPRRPWVLFIPASEADGFEFGLRFGDWALVGLEEWLEAAKAENKQASHEGETK